jgi:aryl-alcohol dehydrogenase-like predicted oxidoreductase
MRRPAGRRPGSPAAGHGLPTGKYSPATSFPVDDHRPPRCGLASGGTAKARQLDFLTKGGTRPLAQAQAALAFILSNADGLSVTVGPGHRNSCGATSGLRPRPAAGR